MRIKNKEINARRHRKEQKIKDAARELRAIYGDGKTAAGDKSAAPKKAAATKAAAPKPAPAKKAAEPAAKPAAVKKPAAPKAKKAEPKAE